MSFFVHDFHMKTVAFTLVLPDDVTTCETYVGNMRPPFYVRSKLFGCRPYWV